MGDINFNIEKNVDLNKVVTLDIDKNVDANVNNPDILATAEADAEAFGENALAETDAYTYANEGEGQPGQFVPNPGSIDALGNIDDPIIGADGDDADELADTIEIVFDSAGDPPPDVDDINGFGSLASLSSPPPDTADVPLPDPLLSITDLNLVQVIPDPLSATAEARYENAEDFIVNFGTRTLDLDGDGTSSTDELTLTIPAGSLFNVEFLGAGEVEVIFAGDNPTGTGEFEFDGETYNTEGLVFDAESLEIGDTGDWAFQAASLFGSETPPIPGDGEAFSYAESAAALDLSGGGDVVI